MGILDEGWTKFKDSFKTQTGGEGFTDAKGKKGTGAATYETDWGQIASVAGLIGSATGMFGMGSSGSVPTGYQGGIPNYTANRVAVPNTYDPNRRAGSGGQRYFTDIQYTPTEEGGITQAPMSAEGLAALNASNPAQEMKPIPNTTQTDDTAVKLAAGGIAQLKKGQYLNGATDGMADKIPARIEGGQEARLSDGEFVIPADVVSHLGNGNSDAGAKVLKEMMDRVRKTRTGNKKQGKEINPKKFLPA